MDARVLTRRYMAAPLLTREEEAEAHARGDHARLVRSHMRIATFWAGRLARQVGPEVQEDLIQEGALGLHRAAQTFDPTKARFSTHATWWVRAALSEYLSRNRHALTSKRSHLSDRLLRVLPRLDPGLTDEQIAAAYGASVSAVAAVRRLLTPALSISAPRGILMGEEGEAVVGDLLVDEGPSPEEQVAEQEDTDRRRAWIAAALSGLPERTAEILRLRYLREEPLTLDEIGARFGISKERVRQIEVEGLARMRRLRRD